MTPDQALKEARAGELRPVYLVTGEERHLQTQVTTALRQAALAGATLALGATYWLLRERGDRAAATSEHDPSSSQ